MNLFKNFFPFAFPPTTENTVVTTLNSFEINSNTPLPDNYYNILYTDAANFHQFFTELLKRVPKADNTFALIKLFTIIFKTIREKEYDKEAIELLEQIQIPPMADFQLKENSWICDVAIAIKSYLARLPSAEEVFKRALNFKNGKCEKNFEIYLSDLYRLLNVFGLLFPGLTASLNIVGRYYLKTSPYYSQFYKIIKEEILLGYDYIEHIVSFFKTDFKNIETRANDCFLKTIPEIELYCDRIEEFLMNKYFKGRGPNRKIYFKEEEINEIIYHMTSLQSKSTKSEEVIHTSDEEEFSQFQQ